MAEQAAQGGDRQQSPWLAMSALLVSFLMVVVSATSVSVAIPAMLTELDASLNEIVWVTNGYALAVAVPLLVSGRLGDRVGPKRVLAAGLMIFTAASFACGLATSAPALIAARVVQGLGAAAMTPHTLTLVTHLFPPGRRGPAMGASGAVGGFGAVSGYLLGGLLVDQLGWSWIFFVNLPIGLLALGLTFRFVPDWRPRHSHRFDVLGIALSGAGLAAFVFGIQEGERYGWGQVVGPVTIPSLIGGGLLLLGVFVVWQRLNPREPLLELRVFRHRNLSMVSLAQVSSAFAVTGLWIPLMIYIQSVRGFSPAAAGLLTAPVALIGAALSPLGGWLSDRVDGKWVSLTGFVAMILGVATVATRAQPDTDPWSLLPGLVVIGIATGTLFPPLNNIAMSSLPARLVGGGSGVLRTSQQLGMALGAAATGGVLQVWLANGLPQRAVDESRSLPASYRETFVDSITAAAAAGQDFDAATRVPVPPGTPAQIADQIRQAAENVFAAGFTSATKVALALVAAVLVVGCLSCLAMGRTALRRDAKVGELG